VLRKPRVPLKEQSFKVLGNVRDGDYAAVNARPGIRKRKTTRDAVIQTPKHSKAITLNATAI